LVRIATPNYLGRAEADCAHLVRGLFESIRVAASKVLERCDPDLIVVAYPGPISTNGVALRSPTILGSACCELVNVREQLSRIWPETRIHVVNDLTAAGYFFVAQGHDRFCVVTVGSGIGNKVFLEKRPQVGVRGYGGEIGHIHVRPKPDSPVADIERELGDIASGRGTAWLAQCWMQRHPQDAVNSVLFGLRSIDNEDSWSRAVARAFRSGDRLAYRIVEAAAFPLAHALGSIHLGIGIEQFFVLGGFARALGPRYRDLLAQLATHATWDVGQRWGEMIHIGEGGAEEGLMGACHLAATMARDSSRAAVEAD
jgi:glucokinase